MNGLPHDSLFPGEQTRVGLTPCEITLQVAHHVEQLHRSLVQPIAAFTLRRSLPRSRVHPVVEFTLRRSLPRSGVHPFVEFNLRRVLPRSVVYIVAALLAQDFTPFRSSPRCSIAIVQESYLVQQCQQPRQQP